MTGGGQRRAASLDLLHCPWTLVPTAAGGADSTVCYDLDKVMCEREWNVLSSWPGRQMLGTQFLEKGLQYRLRAESARECDSPLKRPSFKPSELVLQRLPRRSYIKTTPQDSSVDGFLFQWAAMCNLLGSTPQQQNPAITSVAFRNVVYHDHCGTYSSCAHKAWRGGGDDDKRHTRINSPLITPQFMTLRHKALGIIKRMWNGKLIC